MKILHVCPLYSPSIGGNQYHVQLISEGLARLGHDVHVFTANALTRKEFKDAPSKTDRSLPAFEEINGCHVRRFRIHRRLNTFLFHRLIGLRGGYRVIQSLFGSACGYWQQGPLTLGMTPSIQSLKPDVILADMDNSLTTYFCYKAHQQSGIPLVVMPIIHCMEDEPYHRFTPKIYQSADRVIACTVFEKRELIARGTPERNIEVIPPGLPECPQVSSGQAEARGKLGIECDGPVVGYIGRKVSLKGIDTLVMAMNRVWQTVPHAKLILAGDPAPAFAKEYSGILDGVPQCFKKNICDIESFADEDKELIFAALDVLVMVSRVDCFGYVYLEAWASSVPVIAAKDSPQESFIDHGENGCLIEYGDCEALARDIVELFKNESRRRAMGENGRQKWKKEYTAERMVERFENLYKNVLKEISKSRRKTRLSLEKDELTSK